MLIGNFCGSIVSAKNGRLIDFFTLSNIPVAITGLPEGFWRVATFKLRMLLLVNHSLLYPNLNLLHSDIPNRSQALQESVKTTCVLLKRKNTLAWSCCQIVNSPNNNCCEKLCH